MDLNDGVERMIQAFDSGWQAGASLGGNRLRDFADAGPDLQMFWLDGFYTAQAHFGTDAPIVDDAYNDRDAPNDAVAGRTAEHRLSHPIARALRAAYHATGEAPSFDSLTTTLARLDLLP